MKTKTDKAIKVSTWLPIFSGFYGTIWETDNDEEMELEYINEQRTAKGLPKVDWDDVDWDYTEYQRGVVEGVTKFVGHELANMGLISKYRLEKLVSPREYNFRNDSIDVAFYLTSKNKQAIERYLVEHKKEFAEYLDDRYTSYSGFCSYYSNSILNWMNDLDETLTHSHKLGSVLEFILKNENQIDEATIYEHLKGNGVTLHAKNCSKLIGE